MRRILKDSFENICYLSARKDEEPKILRPFCLQSNNVIVLFYFQSLLHILTLVQPLRHIRFYDEYPQYPNTPDMPPCTLCIGHVVCGVRAVIP